MTDASIHLSASVAVYLYCLVRQIIMVGAKMGTAPPVAVDGGAPAVPDN